MSNVIYTRGLGVNWVSDTIYALLVRSTSSYVANKDHDYVSEFSSGGGVEVSVASYVRIALASKTAAPDDSLDKLIWDCADIDFGVLESGQTVKAMILYKQVGGDDTTPADDVMICYIDTDAGALLPIALNGTDFKFVVATTGIIQGGQA